MAKAERPEGPRAELGALARRLESRGDAEGAARARRLGETLEAWEADVARRAGEALAVHHDIRNALTGVLGNAQLLLLGPAADVPGVRKRLETLTREAERIRVLADTLGRARLELGLAGEPGNGQAQEEGGA